MQAQGFKRDFLSAAVTRDDFTVGDHGRDLAGDVVPVDQHGARLRPWQQ